MSNPQSASKWWQFVTIAGRIESIRPNVRRKSLGALGGALQSLIPSDFARRFGLTEEFVSVLDYTLHVDGENGVTLERAQLPNVPAAAAVTVNDEVSLNGYRDGDGVLIVQSGQNLSTGEPIRISGTSLVPVEARPVATAGAGAAPIAALWNDQARYGRIVTVDETRIPAKQPNDLESFLATVGWAFLLPLAITIAIFWLGSILLPYVLPYVLPYLLSFALHILAPFFSLFAGNVLAVVVLVILIGAFLGGAASMNPLGCLFGPVWKLLTFPVTVFSTVRGWVHDNFIRRITATMSKDYPVYTIRLRRMRVEAARSRRRDDNWEVPSDDKERRDPATDASEPFQSGGPDLAIVRLAGFLAKGAVPKVGDFATFYGSADSQTGVFDAVSGVRHPTGEVFAVWRPRWMR